MSIEPLGLEYAAPGDLGQWALEGWRNYGVGL